MRRRPDRVDILIGIILGIVIGCAALIAFRAGQRQQRHYDDRCEAGVSWACRPTTTGPFDGAVAHASGGAK